RDLGWLPGQDVVVDHRPAPDGIVTEDSLREVLRGPVDAVIVGGPQGIRAAMTVTETVPIVGIDLESDPVANGFVKSLGRPGKNVSGVWMDMPELAGKQLQFLGQTVSALRRVGVIWDDRIGQPQWTAVQSAARASNLTAQAVALHAVARAEDALNRLLVERPQALLFLTAPVVFRSLPRLAELAIQHRLP